MSYGGHTVLHWCRMQDAIALSSGEAELKAACKGVQEALGLREALEFLVGHHIPLTHHTDASAAHGIIKRRGAGAVKHLTVRQLWLQEVMRQKDTQSLKIARFYNPSDILCSIGPVDSFKRHLSGMHFELDRPLTSPRGGEES